MDYEKYAEEKCKKCNNECEGIVKKIDRSFKCINEGE